MTDTAGPRLLAVDLGLKSGLATFGADGRLRTYRSSNFGTRERLRRGAPRALADAGPVDVLVVEGDVALARVWGRAAERVGARVLTVHAERWRTALLHPSERRDGPTAKRNADRLARAVIDWSGAARPTSLRHDAAEAVCIGLWGVLEVGWLEALPPALSTRHRGA
jgi:hypothetical protein